MDEEEVSKSTIVSDKSIEGSHDEPVKKRKKNSEASMEKDLLSRLNKMMNDIFRKKSM